MKDAIGRWGLACATACLLMAADALGQAPQAGQGRVSSQVMRIRKVRTTKVRTPQYELQGGNPQGRRLDWLQLQIAYETAPEWIDELSFQVYFLVRSTREQKVLRGAVSYVNVAKGQHLADLYLHPSTLARYGDVQATAVMVSYEGRLIAMETEPQTTQRWWEQLPPTEGAVLNRMQTPFAMIDFDNYEAIKPSAQN